MFMVSWVNPDETLAEKGFDDYMREGVYAALDAVEKATGEKGVNAIGYCLGGTLLADDARAHGGEGRRPHQERDLLRHHDRLLGGGRARRLHRRGAARARSRRRCSKRGYLEGREMATTFNMLRANDLIWSFVVNNYLLGQEPFPFDLLYWNDDSTRMPARDAQLLPAPHVPAERPGEARRDRAARRADRPRGRSRRRPT